MHQLTLIIAALLTSGICNAMDISRLSTPNPGNDQEYSSYADANGDHDNNYGDDNNAADVDNEDVEGENEGDDQQYEPFIQTIVDELGIHLPNEKRVYYNEDVGGLVLNIEPKNHYSAHASSYDAAGSSFILYAHKNKTSSTYALEVIDNIQEQPDKHIRSFFSYFPDHDNPNYFGAWAVAETDKDTFAKQMEENERVKNEQNELSKLVNDQIKKDLTNMNLTRKLRSGSYNNNHYETYPSPIHPNTWHVVMSQSNLEKQYFTYCRALDGMQYLTPITHDVFNLSIEFLGKKTEFAQAIEQSEKDCENAREQLRNAPQIIQQKINAREAAEKAEKERFNKRMRAKKRPLSKETGVTKCVKMIKMPIPKKQRPNQ